MRWTPHMLGKERTLKIVPTRQETASRARLGASEMLETAANDHKTGVTSDQAPKEDATLHEIVIVGGGAAGLELATGLGNTLARHKKARITLVDKSRAHLWKPLLHSVAAGQP
jgi:hypothetical protein